MNSAILGEKNASRAIQLGIMRLRVVCPQTYELVNVLHSCAMFWFILFVLLDWTLSRSEQKDNIQSEARAIGSSSFVINKLSKDGMKRLSSDIQQ